MRVRRERQWLSAYVHLESLICVVKRRADVYKKVGGDPEVSCLAQCTKFAFRVLELACLHPM